MRVKPIPHGYHTVTPYLMILATHQEDLSLDEIKHRAKVMFKPGAA